jgi:hypothetical protein
MNGRITHGMCPIWCKQSPSCRALPELPPSTLTAPPPQALCRSEQPLPQLVLACCTALAVGGGVAVAGIFKDEAPHEEVEAVSTLLGEGMKSGLRYTEPVEQCAFCVSVCCVFLYVRVHVHGRVREHGAVCVCVCLCVSVCGWVVALVCVYMWVGG